MTTDTRAPAGAAVARRYLKDAEVTDLRDAYAEYVAEPEDAIRVERLVRLLRGQRRARVTYDELGAALGVSRQRVHQILDPTYRSSLVGCMDESHPASCEGKRPSCFPKAAVEARERARRQRLGLDT